MIEAAPRTYPEPLDVGVDGHWWDLAPLRLDRSFPLQTARRVELMVAGTRYWHRRTGTAPATAPAASPPPSSPPGFSPPRAND